MAVYSSIFNMVLFCPFYEHAKTNIWKSEIRNNMWGEKREWDLIGELKKFKTQAEMYTSCQDIATRIGFIFPPETELNV